MARRKELRNTIFALEDGFSGTGKVNDLSIAGSDTVLGVDTLALKESVKLIPVGARFTTVGINTIRTVTAENHSMQWTSTTGGATAGTYTLTFNSQTTAGIAFNADAATIQSALEALSNVGVGELLVTGGAEPFTITAAGTLANVSTHVLTIDGTGLTGGSAAVIVVQDGTTTWEVTFSPALAAGSLPVNDDNITFLAQRIAFKVGSGNVTWTENDETIYDLDRGKFDGQRDGDDQPTDVTASFVFDWLRASSGQPITPYEALHRIGGAAAWFNAADDPCDKFAVNLVIEDIPPCGTEEAEVITFKKFYKTSINPDFQAGLINLSGQSATRRPDIERKTVAIVQGL